VAIFLVAAVVRAATSVLLAAAAPVLLFHRLGTGAVLADLAVVAHVSTLDLAMIVITAPVVVVTPFVVAVGILVVVIPVLVVAVAVLVLVLVLVPALLTAAAIGLVRVGQTCLGQDGGKLRREGVVHCLPGVAVRRSRCRGG